ncbi:feruloyl esterase [Paraburkholderia fungorum]|jgi:hypothetical protein|uniref:tannase/feruloyl esterase family alpha/beta hydrolase n=1 Tax=Paraburkholderia fungorum TaxID=134537 RepID=UPI000D070251|nr:tannase/feruloyl esterase family alpha/beta hydrolase [Paraburkholderia fungorum]PRZ52314.1 feruloyl esterase [Paraburkholderia fungorum]
MQTCIWRKKVLWCAQAASCAAGVAILSACGGHSDTLNAPPTAAQQCSSLANANVPASAIGLPTTGAHVTATALVAASGTGVAAVGEYCQVQGSIAPVDSSAPPIKFQLNLPTQWNNKAFQFGGGGFDGTVVTGLGPSVGAPLALTPLGRGYATFGSDSGHALKSPPDFANEAAAYDMSFALNSEALHNYASDQIKKTHDTVMYLIKQRYASLPSHTYFAGGSGGGREAFAALQKWPQDYDGVIAYYPAWPLNEMLLNYGKVARAWAAPNAYVDVAKQTLLYNAEISACDALDGVTDGIISNVKACTFSPATLRCPGGADTGDTCLSDAQISALQTGMGSGLTLTYSVPSGETQYPAYNVFSGVDLRNLEAGTTAPAYPPTATMPFAALISASFVRYGIVQDANYNYLTFDPLNPGIYQSAVASMSTLLDMNATDLSAFQKRGGKLFVVHGAADATIPTASSEQYYARVNATMGPSTVGSFFKFYEVPGYAHGFGQFNGSWDSVSALEGWVERGTAPTNQTVTDANPGTARARPLCEYPSWPKYNGSGDQNAATSYTCVSS